MPNIAHNTYLFYGDKDELVKCHAMLNDIYEKVGSDESCVNVTSLAQNPEWISYIDDINPGLDNRFYMVTESDNYGNPLYWYNWLNNNFTNLSVAFRCEEPGMEIFEQVDPDNELSDVVWVQGRYIPREDVQKLHPTLRDCCHREASGPANSFYVIGSFYRDEVFNNGEHLPDTIEVREYTNTTYDASIPVCKDKCAREELINELVQTSMYPTISSDRLYPGPLTDYPFLHRGHVVYNLKCANMNIEMIKDSFRQLVEDVLRKHKDGVLLDIANVRVDHLPKEIKEEWVLC